MIAIKIENLSFAYPGQKNLFNDLNLDIHQGKLVGIVGPNGSGKSTLLKLILKLLRPKSGQIILSDQKIGYVPQRATAFNTGFPATVEEVVNAPLKVKYKLWQGLTTLELAKTTQVLEYTGLNKLRKNLIGNLSGGQQQRAFIARALITEPTILFLDEPFVGIDQYSQSNISSLLHNLNQTKGTTIIMITHDLRWVTNEVDLMVCLENGQIHCHQQLNGLDQERHIIYHQH